MQGPIAKKGLSYLALIRLNAFSFGLTGFILAMDMIVLPVLVLVVAPEGLKNTYLGLLGFTGLIIAALVQPLIGRYSDRTRSPLGRRIPYLLWGSIFASLGLAGIGLAPNYFILFAAWAFIQVNANIAYGPFQALIRDLVPLDRIGSASSLKILSDAAGGIVLVALSGALVSRYTGTDTVDWLWLTLGILAAILIATAAITSLTVRARESPTEAGPKDPQEHHEPELHPQLGRFLLSRFLMFTAIAIFQTYGLFFLRDVVELKNPAQAMGNMVVVIGGALALSIYPAGWISDRVGRKPVVLVGALAAALGSIALLSADSVTEVLIIASVIGMSVGTLMSANWALANDLGTEGREAQHMGIVGMATVGGTGMAKILGPGVDLLNHAGPDWGYSALLVTSALFFLVGALLLLPLKTPAHQ